MVIVPGESGLTYAPIIVHPRGNSRPVSSVERLIVTECAPGGRSRLDPALPRATRASNPAARDDSAPRAAIVQNRNDVQLWEPSPAYSWERAG